MYRFIKYNCYTDSLNPMSGHYYWRFGSNCKTTLFQLKIFLNNSATYHIASHRRLVLYVWLYVSCRLAIVLNDIHYLNCSVVMVMSSVASIDTTGSQQTPQSGFIVYSVLL